MTFAEAEKILDEENTYWDFNGDDCTAYYFTWMPDDDGRIGYLSQHLFYIPRIDFILDPEDWEDANRWSDLTFGNAFDFPTYIDDIYSEEDLIRTAQSLTSLPKMSNKEAMAIMREVINEFNVDE